MNYFAEAENVLQSLPVLKQSLKNLESRKKRIIDASRPKDIKAIDFEKQYCGSAYVNDTYGDMIEFAETARQIAYTAAKIDEIEKIIKQLYSQDYEKIIEMWYVQKKPKEQIMRALSFNSLKSVYDIRNRAVTLFAILYFGADAL